MADVEEPQFTTLAQRIAALKQQQAGDAAPQNNTLTVAKRPPPPPIPSSDRPPLPTRPKTANNPPITYGSSINQKPFNEPIGAKPNSNAPTNNTKSPALPARNAPPPLPTRKASTPNLPPRRASTSTQLARRDSVDSTISQVSTVSAMSLNSYGRPASSRTSTRSSDGRMLPPPLDMAKLPPLPPSRRELQEKARLEQKAKMPLVSVSMISIILVLGVIEGSSIFMLNSVHIEHNILFPVIIYFLLALNFLDSTKLTNYITDQISPNRS